MLALNNVIAFVATLSADRARAFYRDTLGLPLVSEDPFALVFDAHGIMLRVSIVPEMHAANYTVLGWQVADIRATIAELAAKGIRFERYAFLQQDEHAVWTAPSGAQVAWFQDPDGNVLSLTQFSQG